MKTIVIEMFDKCKHKMYSQSMELRKKPKRTHVMAVRLSGEEAAKIEQLMQDYGIAGGEVVRQLLAPELDKVKLRQKQKGERS